MKHYYFYTSNQGNGKTYPVVKDENGQLIVYDCDTKKTLPDLKKQILRCREICESRLVDYCEEINVNTLDELCIKAKEYEELRREWLRHISFQAESAGKLIQFKKSYFTSQIPTTYAKTKKMGCTDIVYWNNEPQINPKTNNEFFTPEDAGDLFEKLKQEHADEIEDEEDEVWKASNYIWEQAALLDDLIWEEKNKPEYTTRRHVSGF